MDGLEAGAHAVLLALAQESYAAAHSALALSQAAQASEGALAVQLSRLPSHILQQ